MVKPFQFARLPKILFKNGSITELPDHILNYGHLIVLVTGKSSFINSMQAERLLKDLKRKNIEFLPVKIHGEPTPDDIDSVVKSFHKENIDLVVGIGGGSVLDAGKAISAMIHKQESVLRYLEGVGDIEHPGTRLPYIAIPTTSGTGSEATKNAVISKTGKNGFKKSLRHDNFVPDLAVIDPELTINCPPDITATSGMDCFTQLTEAFLSDKASEYTDALAMEGLKAIKLSLTRCCFDGRDIEARSGMSFAALTSGICLTNAGLGIVHGFASSVGSLFDIPHGLVCGTLMAKSNEINVRELRKTTGRHAALQKYSMLGQIFLEERGSGDDFYIDGFLHYLHKLTLDLGLPGFKKYGVEEKDIAPICSRTDKKNNPVKLGTDDLGEIIRSRLQY
jgi:alcohol dehydrogenase class IV